MRLLLACFAAFSVVTITVATRKPNVIPRPTDDDDELVDVMISVTLTPYMQDGGVEISDEDRLQQCEDAINELHVEFQLRHGDGQVPYVAFSRERGEENNHPHCQGMYNVRVPGSTARDGKKLLAAEKAWMKSILARLPGTWHRIRFKTVKAKDRRYCYGYIFKDTGKPHLLFFQLGFTPSEIQDMLDEYRANAGKNTYTSRKMNKNPANKGDKQLLFTVGAVFVMARWFAEQHKLGRILPALSLAMIVGLALQTGRYFVDESIVTGKNGGVALDATRANALWRLGFASHSSLKETVPLLEMVLYGAREPPNETLAVQCQLLGIPTPQNIVQFHDLKSLKAMCEAHKAAKGLCVRPGEYP